MENKMETTIWASGFSVQGLKLLPILYIGG